MQPRLRALASIAFLAGTFARASNASAAPAYVERPITLPSLVFAGDVGIGVGHVSVPTARDLTGPGLNLEGSMGITDSVEVGIRTGVRFGNEGQAVQADTYGRTLWTETYGTSVDTVANPELRVRWSAYSGRVVEVALDGRVYLPIEDGSRIGVMFGVPLAFHVARFLRIDTGAYVPVVFVDPVQSRVSIPAYFWFQPTSRFWLGPMTALRFVDQTDVLLGMGLGVQVHSAVDLKAQLFFPRINGQEGARNFGAGFGVQFRIND